MGINGKKIFEKKSQWKKQKSEGTSPCPFFIKTQLLTKAKTLTILNRCAKAFVNK